MRADEGRLSSGDRQAANPQTQRLESTEEWGRDTGRQLGKCTPDDSWRSPQDGQTLQDGSSYPPKHNLLKEKLPSPTEINIIPSNTEL
jgi:hypothetical protein